VNATRLFTSVTNFLAVSAQPDLCIKALIPNQTAAVTTTTSVLFIPGKFGSLASTQVAAVMTANGRIVAATYRLTLAHAECSPYYTTGWEMPLPQNCPFLWGSLNAWFLGWLCSRVVSVMDSGAEGPGSNRSRDAVG